MNHGHRQGYNMSGSPGSDLVILPCKATAAGGTASKMLQGASEFTGGHFKPSGKA